MSPIGAEFSFAYIYPVCECKLQPITSGSHKNFRVVGETKKIKNKLRTQKHTHTHVLFYIFYIYFINVFLFPAGKQPLLLFQQSEVEEDNQFIPTLTEATRKAGTISLIRQILWRAVAG